MHEAENGAAVGALDALSLEAADDAVIPVEDALLSLDECLPPEILGRIVLHICAALGPGVAAARALRNFWITSKAFRRAIETSHAWREAALAYFAPLALPESSPWLRFREPSDLGWMHCVLGTCWNLHALSTPLAVERAWGGSSARPSTAPLPPSFSHTAVLHRGVLYVFGGRHLGTHSNRLFSLDLGSPASSSSSSSSDDDNASSAGPPQQWRCLDEETSGTPPLPRRQHTAVVDARGRMVVIGGGCLEPGGARLYYPDTHALDLETLTWALQPPPPEGWSCMAHTCVAATCRGGGEGGGGEGGGGEGLLVYGGLTTRWEEFASDEPNQPPMLVEQPVVSDLVMRYDVASDTWAVLTTAGAPPTGRFRHSATMVRGIGDGGGDGASATAMAIWGGFTVERAPPDEHGQAQPGWDERCSNELWLLDVPSLVWHDLSSRLRGPTPAPRGGHSATAVGDYLVLVGGCDGGEPNEEDEEEAFVERDLHDVHVLDMAHRGGFDRWEYRCVQSDVGFPPRSGHTAHLLPCDGGLAVLVIGGRRYEPPPPDSPWVDGRHYGRDDAYRLKVFDGADTVALKIGGAPYTSRAT